MKHIAIIDSGINEYGLNILNIEKYESFFDDKRDTYLHGTACAMLINKLTSDNKFYILKILNNFGDSSSEMLIESLYHLLHTNVDVINLSISTNSNKHKVEIGKVCKKLFNEGKIIVASQMNAVNAETYPAYLDCVYGVHGTTFFNNNYYIFNKSSPLQFTFDSSPVIIKVGESVYKLFKGNSKACALATSFITNKLPVCNYSLTTDKISKTKYNNRKDIKYNNIKINEKELRKLVHDLFYSDDSIFISQEIFNKENTFTIDKAIRLIQCLEKKFELDIEYESVNFGDLFFIENLLSALKGKWSINYNAIAEMHKKIIK